MYGYNVVSVCTCVVCVHVRGVCAHAYKIQISMLGVSLSYLPPDVIKQSLSEPGAHQLAGLANQQVPGTHLSLPPGIGTVVPSAVCCLLHRF